LQKRAVLSLERKSEGMMDEERLRYKAARVTIHRNCVITSVSTFTCILLSHTSANGK